MSSLLQSSTRTLSALALLFFGCSAAQPLSIKLRDPKTNMVQNCSARESAAREIPVLAAAVEACARALEARGYVRADDAAR